MKNKMKEAYKRLFKETKGNFEKILVTQMTITAEEYAEKNTTFFKKKVIKALNKNQKISDFIFDEVKVNFNSKEYETFFAFFTFKIQKKDEYGDELHLQLWTRPDVGVVSFNLFNNNMDLDY